MSTNFHICAKREIQVVRTGKITTQSEPISVWQTPSDVSRELIKAESPLNAYFDWVISISEDQEEQIYADDDVFCEEEPVSHQTINLGKEHVAELKETLSKLEAEGWEIEFSIW